MRGHNIKFYGSISFGILMWMFFYVVTPIEAKNSLSFEAFSFICLSYVGLIAGFYMSPDILSKNIDRYKEKFAIKTSTIVKSIIILVIISFAFRYYDLFFNRDLSFLNTSTLNNRKASDPESFSFLFGLLAMFRVLYFVPLIYCYAFKVSNKKLLAICFLLFVLPLLEGYLRESRRIIFESFILLTLILIFFNKINLRSYKTYIVFSGIIITLLSYSFIVIQERAKSSPDKFYEKIYTSPYNDFVPIKEKAVKYIEKNKNSIMAKAYFSEIHIGQYITHGVFEMDHMMSVFKNHTYGMYNAYLFIKFLNKMRITNVDLSTLNNPSDRNTYITFFGGLYLDFGWLSLIVMFVFGFVQKQLFSLGKRVSLITPLVIVLCFSNIFLLVMNFIRAQFVLTFGVFFVFISLLMISTYFGKEHKTG